MCELFQCINDVQLECLEVGTDGNNGVMSLGENPGNEDVCFKGEVVGDKVAKRGEPDGELRVA